MSSRGCQVSLTVAAMVVLAVMVGGYAFFRNMSGSSERSTAANDNRAMPTTASTPLPDTMTNSNANPTVPARAFMRYHLLLSETALDEQTRALGDKPIPAGQSLQFAFESSEDGFLYMLGHDEQGSSVVMPLGTFVAPAEVKADQETELPALAHIKLNSEAGTETFTVIFSTSALDIPFAGESLPIDGSFRKLTVDEQRKIKELRQQSASASVKFNGNQEDGDAVVMLSGERGGKPVVFDIKLQLKH